MESLLYISEKKSRRGWLVNLCWLSDLVWQKLSKDKQRPKCFILYVRSLIQPFAKIVCLPCSKNFTSFESSNVVVYSSTFTDNRASINFQSWKWHYNRKCPKNSQCAKQGVAALRKFATRNTRQLIHLSNTLM